MKISIIESGRIRLYENEISQLFALAFGQNVILELNSEFVCAVLVHDDNKLISCGFAYQRSMKQNNFNFEAGILGGIAVAPEFQGNGLGKVVVANLDNQLALKGVQHSFLFAYDPKIYLSSGYSELVSPIRYFDTIEQQWNEFVYRGGMVKSYVAQELNSKQLIEFKGCVY